MKFTQHLIDLALDALAKSDSCIFVDVDGHPHIKFDEIAVYMGLGAPCFELRYKGIPLLREGSTSAWRKDEIVITGVQGTHRIDLRG